MSSILDLVERAPAAAPWSEGDNIPWDEPGFSERMLKEHLSQDHDLASRRSAAIDRHAEWIHSQILGSGPAKVLDLACGPGFYTLRLARLGCECVGIDFSPASIRHARETASAEPGLSCSHRQADLRDGEFGDGFDLAMLVYGQLNVFPRARGLAILQAARAALRDGGSLLLEIQGRAQIQEAAQGPATWYSARSGLFSEAPHLVLQENFWHADVGASTIRFSVVDAETATVTTHALSNEAYTDEELDAALASAGFADVERFPSLTGSADGGSSDLPVIVARAAGPTSRD